VTPTRRSEHSEVLASAAVVRQGRGKALGEWRAHACPVTLFGADLAAFVAAVSLAFSLTAASGQSPYAGAPYSGAPYFRALENLNSLGTDWHGWGSFLVLACLLGYFGTRGHYTARVPSFTVSGDVAIAAVVAFACDAFLTLAVYDRPLQLEGLLRWALLCPCLLLARWLAREALRASGLWSLDTLVVANPGDLAAATEALRSDPALGYKVVGTIRPATAAAMRDHELMRMVTERGFDFVVAAVGGDRPDQESAVIRALHRGGVSIGLVPVLPELPVAGFRRHYFVGHDLALLVGKNNLTVPFNRMLKTVFDHIAAAVLVVLFAPLLTGLALLVRADGGPVFFRQLRIGAGGREFSCLKFRTMVVYADRQLQHLLRGDPRAAAEWAADQKLTHDPRITRVGAFLRRSSLDELPQLLNVLRGEMSLVGPRPIVAAEVARYGRNIEYYYETKPGITGLWQVSGRNDTGYARRVKLDVWYVRNWSLGHDIAILCKTVPAVFLRRGAH
jgi:Undecaprenyl-phosphate galactose phosphotransferase WbaP